MDNVSVPKATDGMVAKMVRRVALFSIKDGATWHERGTKIIDDIEVSGHSHAKSMAGALRAAFGGDSDAVCESARRFFDFPKNWKTEKGSIVYVQ